MYCNNQMRSLFNSENVFYEITRDSIFRTELDINEVMNGINKLHFVHNVSIKYIFLNFL